MLWACATSPYGRNAGSATTFGVDPDAVAVEHVGLNHLTWIRSAHVELSHVALYSAGMFLKQSKFQRITTTNSIT